MVVLLSDDAYVKTLNRGETKVGDLQDGEEAVAYNVVQRQLLFVTVRVRRVDPRPRLSLLIRHMRWINLLPETQGYTLNGPVAAETLPPKFHTYCVINPLKMVPRDLEDVAELGPAPATEISWGGDAYLWSEGILVGSR